MAQQMLISREDTVTFYWENCKVRLREEHNGNLNIYKHKNTNFLTNSPTSRKYIKILKTINYFVPEMTFQISDFHPTYKNTFNRLITVTWFLWGKFKFRYGGWYGNKQLISGLRGGWMWTRFRYKISPPLPHSRTDIVCLRGSVDDSTEEKF